MTPLVEESVLIYLHRKAAKKYTSLPCCEQNANRMPFATGKSNCSRGLRIVVCLLKLSMSHRWAEFYSWARFPILHMG
jgi:hypothetical protein